MPQMSPMWWTTLMMLFTFLFVLLMVMMYFELKKSVHFKTKLNFQKMNWKW
uniref:ATP synthase F0 subunit 8 n=1 Tax=Empoascanara quarta TaxID=3057154 RepID=A0AA51RID4_9HEMI|nr:ATP synthase F0 subunit 8 [Empoascanara quarta]WMQ52338.1 ATP synthase F0 subunit 8 [Empoascanara quarta]